MTEHAHPTIKTFVAVWATLLVLTAVTVFVATLELGPFNAIVALSIATVKALLVLLFFMELRYSTALTKVAVVAAVFFLMLLAGLTLSDYLTRGWTSYINPFH
jgi:cytochrome c oxidase subunit IV